MMWANKVAQELLLLPHSRKVPGVNEPRSGGDFRVEFACSPLSAGFLWVLPVPIPSKYVQFISEMRKKSFESQRDFLSVMLSIFQLECRTLLNFIRETQYHISHGSETSFLSHQAHSFENCHLLCHTFVRQKFYISSHVLTDS